MPAIQIRNLIKKFGDDKAVDNLSLIVPENKIFGLLGSNGAGKTTTINILTGLLLPDNGSVNILGLDVVKDIQKIRTKISLVPQTISLYDNLTIYENMEFFGGLYIKTNSELKSKIDYYLDLFHMKDKKNVKISNLSGGYQRRCSIACSVISSPKILFLDEPSTGIDMYTNKIILDFIKSLKDITVIITTHSIKEAETLCDYVVFMDRGKKVLEGVPKQIIKEYSKYIGETITIDFDINIDVNKVKQYLEKSNFNIRDMNVKNKSISFVTSDLGNSVIDVMNSLKSLKSNIINIDISKPTLEDIFNKFMEKNNEII
ncbi:MAG: ABC transporter ATP-binding protein [Candidatus Woesearchaeota archaeon]